jgi:hypothetical protein
MRGDLVAIVGVLCWAGVAHADPEAKRLFDEGRALVERGQPDEACKRFAQSLERERAGGTMLNLGECAERAGELVRAWLLYDEAAREYERTNKESGQKFARERAAALEPRLATVIVRVAEPEAEGLVLRVGDDDVPPAAKITRFYDPGALKVTARAPGRERFEATVEGVAGKAVTVLVPALKLRARETAGPVAPPVPAPDRAWRITFWTAAGLGVAAGGVWIYAARRVGDASEELCGQRSPCETAFPHLTQEEIDRIAVTGHRYEAVTYAAAGAFSVSLVVAGIGLYKGYLRPRSRDGAALAIAPIASPQAIGLSLTGGF